MQVNGMGSPGGIKYCTVTFLEEKYPIDLDYDAFYTAVDSQKHHVHVCDVSETHTESLRNPVRCTAKTEEWLMATLAWHGDAESNESPEWEAIREDQGSQQLTIPRASPAFISSRF